MDDMINIGACMTSKAVGERAEKEYAEKEAKLLEERKARRVELLEAARNKPHRPMFIFSFFRGRRTITEV